MRLGVMETEACLKVPGQSSSGRARGGSCWKMKRTVAKLLNLFLIRFVGSCEGCWKLRKLS